METGKNAGGRKIDQGGSKAAQVYHILRESLKRWTKGLGRGGGIESGHLKGESRRREIAFTGPITREMWKKNIRVKKTRDFDAGCVHRTEKGRHSEMPRAWSG